MLRYSVCVQRTHPCNHPRLAQLEPVVWSCLQAPDACALQVLPPQHAPHMNPDCPVCSPAMTLSTAATPSIALQLGSR